MPNLHSKWSASGFESVMLCPGKKSLETGLPNRASKYSSEGTCAHQVLTWALQENRPASAYIGRVIEADGFTFDVDEDMAGHVQVCIDYVRDVAGDDGIVLVDIRVCYAEYLGVLTDDGWGTADVIVLKGDEIIVIDFKYGAGVEVSAGHNLINNEVRTFRVTKPNPQMALYGLGALAAYNGIEYDFTRVRLVISQPRISTKPSEYDLSVAELEAWGRGEAKTARLLSERAADDFGKVPQAQWDDVYLRPAEKACKFCKAKATCAGLRKVVFETSLAHVPASPDDFDKVTETSLDQAVNVAEAGYGADIDDWLGACLSKVDLIEDWCKAVRAEVECRLLAGKPIPGFKLVEGKQGNRAWADAATAEATLKSFRLKIEDMYDLKLISPTSAEKLAKAKQGEPLIGPRQWTKLQGLITRAPAKPHVAPESDPRPALDIKPVADEFDSVAPSGAEEFA